MNWADEDVKNEILFRHEQEYTSHTRLQSIFFIFTL